MTMQALAAVAVPLAVAIIMFCLGLELDASQFLRRRQRNFLIAGAILWQIAVFPALALGIAFVFGIDPALTIGLVLIAACPSSTPANLLTRLAGADVALSVTLTGLTQLLTPLTLPAALALAQRVGALGDVTNVSLWTMSLGLLALTTLPMTIGMLVRRMTPGLAATLQRGAVQVASTAFIVGVAIAIAASWEALPAAFAAVGVACAALNVLALAVSFAASHLGDLPASDRGAVILASSTRSFTTAAFVTLTLWRDPPLLAPALTYCLIMWLSAALVVRAHRVPRPAGPAAWQAASAKSL